jgi:hypothetical protein
MLKLVAGYEISSIVATGAAEHGSPRLRQTPLVSLGPHAATAPRAIIGQTSLQFAREPNDGRSGRNRKTDTRALQNVRPVPRKNRDHLASTFRGMVHRIPQFRTQCKSTNVRSLTHTL